MKKRLILLVVTALFAIQAQAEPTYPVYNKDGSYVSAILTAGYNPRPSDPNVAPIYPFPFNLFYLGTTDLTLNPPVADPNNFADPTVALSALDGFSTTAPWATTFYNTTQEPFIPRTVGQIDPASVIPGQSVRVFQVTLASFVVVTGIVEELIPGVDYTATVVNGGVVAIIPLIPLKEYKGYMAVLTNDITDTKGNNATPDQTYWATKRRTPWVDSSGNSTYSLIPNATAQALEPQRQITQSMELNAAAYGVNPDDIVLSWTIQTQSITPVLSYVRATAQPGATTIVSSNMSTAAVGGAGIADIYIGIITLPYYLGVPSAANPVAPLVNFWKAAPGAYIPPYNQFGLDPTSTNLTFANPFPVKTSDQTVPVLMTVPNASSGQTRPAAGWPVVIFAHAIGENRTNMLAVADTLALFGFAVVAIDAPLHGVVPQVTPQQAPFYIGNTPFGAVANERTFNVDYINNTTGAPGPDGIPDPSGTHFYNLSSMLTSRDNLRQGETDLSILALSIPGISFDGDTIPDLDASNIALVGLSLGSIMGTAFVAVEPTVSVAHLSVPMGGLALSLEASQTFGPRVRAGLAAVGLTPGTASYQSYFTVFQTVLDSADPINWSIAASAFNDIMLHEVIGDTVAPNSVPGAPLSGTEPMIRVMGLTSYSSTQVNPDGLSIAGRFEPPASHPSLLLPTSSPAATAEMQEEMGTFVYYQGNFVQVSNPSVLRPVAQPQPSSDAATPAASGSEPDKLNTPSAPVDRSLQSGGSVNE